MIAALADHLSASAGAGLDPEAARTRLLASLRAPVGALVLDRSDCSRLLDVLQAYNARLPADLEARLRAALGSGP